MFGLAQVREDTLNIPVAYYTCGSKAFFSDKKIHAKYVRIYEANFAIAEVHEDFSIMDSEWVTRAEALQSNSTINHSYGIQGVLLTKECCM